MPRRIPLVLWVAALAGLGPLAARGAGDELSELARGLRGKPFELTADALEFESARELYVARGNVRIVQEGRTLRADWIAFNASTGAGVASGNVELVDGGDVVTADFVEFNVTTLAGVIRNGSFESEQSSFRARGEEITKSEGRRYGFRNGMFTSCRCPDEDAEVPWRIRASEVDVEIEGYGTARNTTVDVLGVPVVWFPWMIYPIKTERQTGLLFPDMSVGNRNGFELGLPFFWAARDELNATLTPRWTSKRGFKADGELEYVYGRESSGRLFGAYAYDQDIDPDTPEYPFGRNRWSALGSQDARAPGGVRLQADFRFASDNEYPLDFQDLAGERPSRYLVSTGRAGRGFGGAGRFGLEAAAVFVDDMQNPDDVDRDRFAYQRLPDVYAAVLPSPLPWLPALTPSLEMDYTYFHPLGSARAERPTALVGPDGLFLDTGVDSLPDAQEGPSPAPDPHADNADQGGSEGDGVFQEGEPLLDEGSRLWLHPRLAAPFALAGVDVYPELGWHQTLYETRLRDFQERGFLTGRVDLRARLRRRFAGGGVHLLEPTLSYALTTAHSQSDGPLFVPGTLVPQQRLRALDLDSVTRDTADRLPRANRLSFGFANRFYAAHAEGEAPRLLGDVTLLGLYEFEERGFRDVVLDGRAYPWQRARARFNLSYDPEASRVDEALAQLGWRHRRGHGFELAYRYLRDVPETFEAFAFGRRWENFEPIERVDQIDASLRVSVLTRWTLAYRIAYSFDEALLLANRGLVEYLSRCGCWAAGLQLSDDRARGLEVKVLYRLVGLGREIGSGGGGFLDAE